MKNWLAMLVTAGLPIPWLFLALGGFHGDPMLTAALSGLAIFGAAFLLAWAAEVAQLDVSQALALGVLALIAVLPEYSVDMYFAWKAAHEPSYASFAIANMTGANRLLIGFGWSLIVILYWWRRRQRVVSIGDGLNLELSVLIVATIYAFVIAVKGTLSIVDAVVLMGLFVLYIIAISRQPRDEHIDLVGPAAVIGALPALWRRLVTLSLFVYAGISIWFSAEPFAEGLVETGSILGVEEFLLVQWLAPLASEAPEFIVAALFAVRGHAAMALRAMVSSKVNQWTLLVGMLPLVYGFGVGQPAALALDARQVQEVVLTAAQSAFAVVILSRLSISLRHAVILLTLFAVQLMFPSGAGRYAFSAIYILLTVWLVVRNAQRRAFIIAVPASLRRVLSNE